MNIHLIFNAHIDPVWLWPWQAGLDEVLATCRSACDRLDNHPDLTFTRGEAWAYDMIEQIDPSLFNRVKAHVASGRWEITGGWWIQPDCNAPSGWALDKQIEIGQRYFESRFGQVPFVGYNVDSFGHAATLPKLLRDHGQTHYVMMRPGSHEMELPARIFRWRGYEDGPEVTVFRIANNTYTTRELRMNHIEASLTELPEGVEDTMCFLGLGDHGGGPTEAQIAWLRERWSDLPGVNFLFSTPSRFFEAISKKSELLPLVTGELQMHAVGCYSVYRDIKTSLRRAEHIVHRADKALAGTSSAIAPDLLERSWRNIAFAQFHDTLGGTCLPSAYRQIIDQLGLASSIADEALHMALRKKAVALPDSKRQRILAWNASDMPHDGYLEFEAWTEYRPWGDHWRLIDDTGIAIPFQRLAAETPCAPDISRLLFRADLQPGALRVFEIDMGPGQAAAPVSNAVSVDGNALVSGKTTVDEDRLVLGALSLPKPRLDLIVDKTDTWSHNTDRFGAEPVASAYWEAPNVVDKGPLMASTIQHGQIGKSALTAEWRVCAGLPYADLRLRVHWEESFKVLKLVIPCELDETRIDGIVGGSLVRLNVGKEVPVRDWTALDGPAGRLGIVCPDVYALDADRTKVRLTLLRSPLMAWTGQNPKQVPRGVVSDQGVHDFCFRFYSGSDASIDVLDSAGIAMQRPPITSEITKGMNPGIGID